jgi:hypothetical protein
MTALQFPTDCLDEKPEAAFDLNQSRPPNRGEIGKFA